MILGKREGFVSETQRMSAMADVPLFHFLHLNNLKTLFESGCLYSDARVRAEGIPHEIIGYSSVKQTRLETVIPDGSGLTVGQCVPFYYATKMPMLYVIHKANSPLLVCRDGQSPIVYLRFNVAKVHTWAAENGLKTYVSDGNAAAAQSIVYSDVSALQVLNWDAIHSSTWGGDQYLQSKKLSEFLVEDRVNLALLEEIGVFDSDHRKKVAEIAAKYAKISNVPVSVHRAWYF